MTDDINLTNFDADKMVAELGSQQGKTSPPFKWVWRNVDWHLM